MKKITSEFKTFISRGNIIDMAVGIIVGSAFTAIVNAMSNNILKPLINLLLTSILGADTLSEAYTMLRPAYNELGELVLEESIYIDWGTFINAILNFFIVALVLFIIVKVINTMHKKHKEIVEDILDDVPTKEDRKEMKKRGIKLVDKDAVEAFMNEKKRLEEEKAEQEKLALAEKERQARLDNPTTEDLLKDILKVLKEK